MGLCEIYLLLTTTDYRHIERQVISGDGRNAVLRVDHEILGYAPRSNTKWTATKRYKDELVYQVEYTIDPHGLRAIPNVSTRQNTEECILFFGGSFTFGEGLNDNETLPHLLSVRSAGKYEIYNFAYSGYGPHQALAALESDRVKTVTGCKPTYALLLTMTGHVPRSAGRELWDTSGPRYRLDSNREATLAGYFDDEKDAKNEQNGALSTVIAKFRWQLSKSYLYRTVSTYVTEVGKYSDENVTLYLAIVQKIGEVLESRYNNEIEFHVIFFDHTWDGTSRSVGEKVLRGLHTSGIEVHMVKDILPDSDVETDRYKYKVSKYDDHPNAIANALLAEYVMKNIIK